MYKLIIVHERSEGDQLINTVANDAAPDNALTSEPAFLDEIRSFLAQAFKVEAESLSGAASSDDPRIRQPYICCIRRSPREQQQQLDISNCVPACDELRSTPIYAKELHELLIKAKLNK